MRYGAFTSPHTHELAAVLSRRCKRAFKGVSRDRTAWTRRWRCGWRCAHGDASVYWWSGVLCDVATRPEIRGGNAPLLPLRASALALEPVSRSTSASPRTPSPPLNAATTIRRSLRVKPVHTYNNVEATSNMVEATFDFVEATFDFVATNGKNVKRLS